MDWAKWGRDLAATIEAAVGKGGAGGVVQDVVISGGGGNHSTMQFASGGRRFCTGPGYVVAEDLYWLTPATRIGVRHGVVSVDGMPLEDADGQPVPGYREGGGLRVLLRGGRLWINDHEIREYVAPPGAERTSVDQRS